MRSRESTTSVSVRFPVELHKRIKRQARSEHRSFNGQVVKTLTEVIEAYEAAARKHTA